MLHAALLLGQKTRLAKFQEAIERIVNSDDYVVDLGTGSGILAIMAAKAGAQRVTAIDINRESIRYAREASVMNDVHDKIEFVEGHFKDFVPEVKADVVICEMLSSIMLIEQQVHACNHAVRHVMKSGGQLIPQDATIYMVPVESQLMIERFSVNGLRFPRVVQTISPEASRDLADAMILRELNFTKTSTGNAIDEVLNFKIMEDGIIHGLVGLFESKLHDDIILKMEDGWKQLFLPLDPTIKVETGDEFSVRIAYIPGEYNSLIVEPQ
jgi:predicted RNA methylase